ncbi:glycosyltransferase [Amphritea sp. HPY]|uniref:glycosyltransferase n=1 Tax=Amphritea sp. HPY TaxID=3421652 RepID=UPI003D7D0179
MNALDNLPVVIVPAYNESTVILKLLRSLNEGVVSGHYNVVVACNGCKDDTTELVIQNFPEYICLDIEKASKTNALNEAESLGLGYPRVYVDADVDISSESVLKLIQKASYHNEAQLVAPRGSINTSQSDTAVSLFYSAWTKTTFFINQGFGSGVYVLNKAARDLFDRFPDVIADDGFVRHLSAGQNTLVCEDAVSAVEAPRTLSDLIKIKTRVKVGNSQLAGVVDTSTVSLPGRRFVVRPGVLEFIIYSLVNLYVRFKVNSELQKGSVPVWHRDESSRT